MSRILALDYGRARVGVALSAGTLAEPLEVISPEKTIEFIRSLQRQYDIQSLVVGVSEQNMADESKSWGESIAETLNLPVIFVDETLSSVEVERKLREARVPGKARKNQPIDHYAAAIILERYLDDHSGEIL